ncbi:MAG: substrate-binding periplasmic protein [Enterocloster clostridioformis]
MKSKKQPLLLSRQPWRLLPWQAVQGQSPEPAASAKATQANPSEHAKTDNSGNDTEPAESRTVIVGTAGTGEPYSMVDDQGNWTGAEADLWAEIEARTGWTIEMKQVSDMASSFGELNTGRVDGRKLLCHYRSPSENIYCI